MEKLFVLFLALFAIGGCWGDETTTEEPSPSGIDAAACVFGCLESFERKGVEGDAPAMTTMDLEGSVCDKLDLTALLGMCSSYQKAGTCIGGCVTSASKRVITSGLDYICIHRLEDFKQHMPCFKKKCPSMEAECGQRCGMDLARAEEKWWDQMGVNGTEQVPSRRKRRQTWDTASENTPSPDVTPNPESDDGSAVGEESGMQDTCQFVRCYTNCSQPILVNECGKDAYDLLRQTSNILLSFVMAPMEEVWAAETNSTLSDTMTTCDRYFSQALTDEGVDRSILKNASARPKYAIWSILLSTAALVLAFGL